MIEDQHIPGFWSRRRFVQLAAAGAVGVGMSQHLATAEAEDVSEHGTMLDVPFEKRNPRIAMIGVGGRGTSLLKNLLAAQGQVVAICDIVQDHADRAASLVTGSGQPKPRLYTKRPHDYEDMLVLKDIDLVLVAT